MRLHKHLKTAFDVSKFKIGSTNTLLTQHGLPIQGVTSVSSWIYVGNRRADVYTCACLGNTTGMTNESQPANPSRKGLARKKCKVCGTSLHVRRLFGTLFSHNSWHIESRNIFGTCIRAIYSRGFRSLEPQQEMTLRKTSHAIYLSIGTASLTQIHTRRPLERRAGVKEQAPDANLQQIQHTPHTCCLRLFFLQESHENLLGTSCKKAIKSVSQDCGNAIF